MEPVERQVREGWGDKLWWVHSEALYTTLLCYHRTGETRFLEWHEKVFSYTFRTFPNRDPEVREWKQIWAGWKPSGQGGGPSGERPLPHHAEFDPDFGIAGDDD